MRSHIVASNHFGRNWIRIALLFFFVASSLGSLLRLLYLTEIPLIDYKNILHAHSHLALLGWGFTALCGGLLASLIPSNLHKNVYDRLLLAQMVTISLMTLAFVIEGYGPFSIALSAIFVVVAFLFALRFLSDMRHAVQNGLWQSSASVLILTRWAFRWMILSSLGLLCLPPVIMILGKMHPAYFMAVQFFLHFQLNGWFMYGALALLYHQYTISGAMKKPEQYLSSFRRGFVMLQLSIPLTYMLSITWSQPIDGLFYANSVGVVLQAGGLLFLLKPIVLGYAPKTNVLWLRAMLYLGIGSLIAKALIQIAIVVPSVAVVSYTIRHFIIGFIHLTMLGGFTFTLCYSLLRQGLISQTNLSKNGWILVAIGFLTMEVLLFGQGLLLWMQRGFIIGFHDALFATSLLLPIGIFLILMNCKPSKHVESISYAEIQ